jgi:nucleoid DNA-binding protein
MTEEQKLAKTIANDLKHKEQDVKLVIKSVADFTSFVIQSGERKPIRWPKLGLFVCKPRRVQELEKRGLL